MKPTAFRYQRTTAVGETVAALAASPGRARVLAGGQSLVAELCARTTSADVLVDIAAIADLDHVALDGPEEVHRMVPRAASSPATGTDHTTTMEQHVQLR